MISKKNIRNWDCIKDNSGKYNSVMDEINRNYNVKKTIKTILSPHELFFKVLCGIHQMYNLDTILSEDATFTKNYDITVNAATYETKSTRVNYKVIKYVVDELIVFQWKIDNDIYWSEYYIVPSSKGAKFIYQEAVLKEDTISGLQGMLATRWYKINFQRNFKRWKSIILDKKANNLDKIQNAELKRQKFIDDNQETIEPMQKEFKKLSNKNNLKEDQLARFRSLYNSLEQYNKQLEKLNYQVNKEKIKNYYLEDKWIEFCNKHYQ